MCTIIVLHKLSRKVSLGGMTVPRISKSAIARLEIIGEASRQFLKNGYSNTSISAIAKALEISPGNLTFYFPTKECLLAELVDMLCTFHWKMMEEKSGEGLSSVMAICLELTAMAGVCEEDEIIKDFFISAYSSPVCLDIIRRNDARRAMDVFESYRPEWTDEEFYEAEILVSGIEYATLMTAGNPVPIETRISGALSSILGIYGVPEETRRIKLEKVFAMDYRNIGKQVLADFIKYVENCNVRAFADLLQVRA